MDQVAHGGQSCSHVPQGPARPGSIGRVWRGLLIGEQRGPTRFQQPPTLLHRRPVKGLPPGPGPEHEFLRHRGGPWPHSSWVRPLASHLTSPQPIN